MSAWAWTGRGGGGVAAGVVGYGLAEEKEDEEVFESIEVYESRNGSQLSVLLLRSASNKEKGSEADTVGGAVV